MTAVAIQHRDEIIAQVAKGKRLSDIAPSIGVSPNALSKALKTDPEYRDAIEAGFHNRLDCAEDAIEGAIEQVDVARARARFQAVAWRAEREFPATWAGQANVVNVQVNVAGADQLLAGSAVAMLAEIVPDAAADT